MNTNNQPKKQEKTQSELHEELKLKAMFPKNNIFEQFILTSDNGERLVFSNMEHFREYLVQQRIKKDQEDLKQTTGTWEDPKTWEVI